MCGLRVGCLRKVDCCCAVVRWKRRWLGAYRLVSEINGRCARAANNVRTIRRGNEAELQEVEIWKGEPKPWEIGMRL